MKYPVFRKYPNDRSFFKVIDESHFVEVKLTGNRAELHHFEANILPDRNFIQDMINMSEGHWVESTEDEFEASKRLSSS
jgi:hypothetical protein